MKRLSDIKIIFNNFITNAKLFKFIYLFYLKNFFKNISSPSKKYNNNLIDIKVI